MSRKEYHFMLFPSEGERVRRLRVSDSHFKLAAFGLVLFTAFTFLSLFGFLYYRSSYRDLISQRLESADRSPEKAELAAKIQQLEKQIGKTERFAARLEAMVGSPSQGIKKGIGPIEPSPSVASGVAHEGKSLDYKLSLLQSKTMDLETRINQAYDRHQNRLIFLASTPSLWPVKGWVTSEFGMRHSPLHPGMDRHEGLDIAAQWGTAVSAPADGVVSFAGYKGGLGKTVVIQHGFGIISVYGHTSALFVKAGDRIKRGVRIASVGSTGASTGPHLHYEIHVDGIAVDPMQYILE
ncbi:MAG: M23 family metallopeptidase [Deltaproteobacteria bacterium]|nr:M23 family metallopeptidase [Deltaproteobacteria bacterium]